MAGVRRTSRRLQRVLGGDPVRAARRGDRGRRRLVARRAERQVPRHPVRRAVPPPALAVRAARSSSRSSALNLDEPWATLYWLNPMAGAVEGFRWAMLGGVRPERRAPRRLAAACRLVHLRRRASSTSAAWSATLPTSSEPRDPGPRTSRKRYRLGERDVAARQPARRRSSARRGARSTARAAQTPGARHDLGARRRQLRRASGARCSAIIGRNGAGKTTLLKILSRHHRPDGRRGARLGPRRLAARGRHRLPPRPDRAREHLPERRDPRHAPAARSSASSTRSSRSPRSSASSTRRSSATRAGCTCGSRSPSPRTSSRRS